MAQSPSRNVLNRTNQLIYAFENAKGTTQRTSTGFCFFKQVLGTSNSYKFDVTNNTTENGPQIPTEKRIKLNDCFVPIKMGFAIQKAAPTVATIPIGQAPTAIDMQVSVLQFWPNSLLFTGAAAANGYTEAQNLEGFYNAFMTVNLSTVNVSEFTSLQTFRTIGTAQQGVLSAVGGPYLQNERNRADYGMMPWDQDLAINGLANQYLQINMNASPIMQNVNGDGTNIAVLFFFGVFLLNGASWYKDRSETVFVTKK